MKKVGEPITQLEKDEFMERMKMKALLYGIGSGGGVGYHTKKLKGRDREIMESLTSDDWNHRPW